MRFTEIVKNSLIYEVSMSPGNINKKINEINFATCGIEFEFFVPNMEENVVDNMSSDDMSSDDTCSDIDTVINFFNTSRNNSRELETLRELITSEYVNYVKTRFDKDWNNVSNPLQYKTIKDYIEYNIEEFADDLESTWDELEKYTLSTIRGLSKTDDVDDIKRIGVGIDKIIKNNFENKYKKIYNMLHFDQQNIYVDLAENDKAIQKEFFKENYVYYSNIYENFPINWPYVKAPNGDDSIQMSDLVYILNDILPTKVIQSDSYNEDYYSLGEDGSLLSFDNYTGVELISPPLPLKDMIRDLNTIYVWANDYGCKTNRDCGLHMNVSLNDIDMEQIDYIKLVLFLGDTYILNEYQRITNHYCLSAYEKIQDFISNNPVKSVELLDKMKSNLQSIASDIFVTSLQNKYTSIHIHYNRIECRSPGNNWLRYDINKLSNTLVRIVYAMSIAADPTKHKEEYAKKLYKMIDSGNNLSRSELINTIDVFTKYQVGLIDKQKLITDIKNNNLNKQYIKLDNNNNNKQLDIHNLIRDTFNVSFRMDGGELTTLSIQAKTGGEAINKIRKLYKLNSVQYPNEKFSINKN